MSHQVPFDDSGVPQGNDMYAAGGYADAEQGGYLPQEMPQGGYVQQNYAQEGYMQPGAGGEPYYGGGASPQPQTYARHKVPMIDPIESAKLTLQILVLLVFAGLKRHWKWSVPMGLILGLLAAGILYLAFPLQYGAKATLLMRAEKQQFLFEVQRSSSYSEFMNTQLALMRSPAVIDKALEDTEVAKLPIILKQKNKRDWLQKRLSVRPEGRSEIVTVGIETDDPNASELIVNAVVDVYLKYVEDNDRKMVNTLIQELLGEQRRQKNNAQTFQENIRAGTKQVAGMGGVAGQGGMIAGFAQGESLQRDVYVAMSQLVALKAKSIAIQKLISNPGGIPTEMLMYMNPRFAELNEKRAKLQQDKDELLRVTNSSNLRVVQKDQEIAKVDEEIAKMAGNTDNSGANSMLELMRIQEQFNLYAVEREIQMQEVYLTELENRYKEQLVNNADRSEGAAGVEFMQVQLARVDKTLDQIENRILTVQSEARAPGQIVHLTSAVSSQPSIVQQVMVVGMGAAMFTFFPLFLSIAVERMKPRLYHVSQVRRAIPQVLIGEIMEPPVSWVQGATFRRRLARYRESVHNWCTHLLLSDPFRSCKTLAVASAAGDDGKTFLAVQIAVAMAQMKEGKVLLIDGDMRVGRLHLLFGNEEIGIGLADVLSFRSRLGEAVVQNEKEPNLFLLSAGQLAETPYELLGDGRFREMLDSLEMSPTNPSGYSLIIVVVPPVSNAAESLIMASSTDSTLLCARQGETVLAAMEDVYRKLVNTGSSVDGIVVKDIPYYQMAGRDGGFADKLEQIRLSHLLQYAD